MNMPAPRPRQYRRCPRRGHQLCLWRRRGATRGSVRRFARDTARPARGADRPLGLGQDDAADPHRRIAHATAGAGRGPGTRPVGARRARTCAGAARHRLHLPDAQSLRLAERRGKRSHGARTRALFPGVEIRDTARARHAGTARSRDRAELQAALAVGRAAPARRDRPRARQSTRSWCWPTSPPPRSTRTRPKTSSRLLKQMTLETGTAVLMVTARPSDHRFGRPDHLDMVDGRIRASDIALDNAQRIREFLKGVEPFSALNPADLARIAASMTPRHFEAGEVIIREGDEGDELFLISEGEVEIPAQGPARGRTAGAGRVFRRAGADQRRAAQRHRRGDHTARYLCRAQVRAHRRDEEKLGVSRAVAPVFRAPALAPHPQNRLNDPSSRA